MKNFLTIRVGSWTYLVSEYCNGSVLLETVAPFKGHSEREVLTDEYFFNGWLPRMMLLLMAK